MKDSYSIFPSSLAKLAQSLITGNHSWSLLKQTQLGSTPEKLALCLEKGVFCYEAFTSISKFERMTQVPPKEVFYSSLTEEHITDEEYNRAKHFFQAFACLNMVVYAQRYCELDCLILLEYITKIRNRFWDMSKIDLTNFISLPAFGYSLMLRQLDREVVLCSEMSMFLMAYNGIRGGYSFSAIPYLEVPAEELCKPELEQTTSIHYIDLNSLYPHVLKTAKFPVGQYKWIPPQEMVDFDWSSITGQEDIGYFVELTGEFETTLSCHAKYSDFVPCPEPFEVKFEHLSPYSQELYKSLYPNKNSTILKQKQLVGHLGKRENIVLYGSYLASLLKLDFKIISIRRILTFRQEAFLEDFMTKMTDLRRQFDRHSPESNFTKFLSNSIFGKFMQDSSKFLSVAFAKTPKRCRRLLASPFFKSFRILSSDLAIIYSKQNCMKVETQTMVAAIVLDKSKQILMDLWYNSIHPKLNGPNYHTRVQLSDTDSLIFYQQGLTRREVYKRIKSCMDFSNLPTQHPFFDKSRAGQTGLFKDETTPNIIRRSCSLRAKTYCLELWDPKERKVVGTHNVAKGVNKTQKAKLTFDSYFNTILYHTNHYTTVQQISNRDARLTTVQVRKVSLNSSCLKRYKCNRYLTLPFFSLLIDKFHQQEDQEEFPGAET